MKTIEIDMNNILFKDWKIMNGLDFFISFNSVFTVFVLQTPKI